MENESKSSSEVDCEKVFKSRESLIEWAQDTGRNNGLIIVIKKFDENVDRRRPRISFACERSGVYKKKNNEGQKPKRLKATGTKIVTVHFC
ncbi:hypothetical protein Dsin_018941 [Dipteronia sinensis]|uniref:Uncharacterized protein n=1 Tax=Dipteronia sinensis TaxID=43782 RepID=A0AAE0E2A1_9ROSI|nr:hypothetical protein Dsin_018941 [Dipteronia sinensis]